jgi:hypothetical protein
MYLDRDRIFNEYKRTLIKESPDSITIGMKTYQYDHPKLGNYVGVLSNDGYYAMSNQVEGHIDLSRAFQNGQKLVHNMESDEAAARLTRSSSAIQFRIWPKFEVISFWQDYDPRIVPTVIDAIKKTGGSPESYIYDIADAYGGYKSDTLDGMKYEEFVGQELDGSYLEKEQERNTKKSQNQRALADYKLGNIPQKQTSRFSYRREGD